MPANAKNLEEWWLSIPPEMYGGQPAAPSLPMGPIGSTGAGEDGVVQPDMPSHLVQTGQGPQLLHEGETLNQLPGGAVGVQPNQATLMEMQKQGLPGMQVGGIYTPQRKSSEGFDWETLKNVPGANFTAEQIESMKNYPIPAKQPSPEPIPEMPASVMDIIGGYMKQVPDERMIKPGLAETVTPQRQEIGVAPERQMAISPAEFIAAPKEQRLPAAPAYEPVVPSGLGVPSIPSVPQIPTEPGVVRDYYQQGMDILAGLARGDSDLQRNIANITMGRFGGAAAAASAASRQQAAQMGLTASQQATAAAVMGRDIDVQRSDLIGKLAQSAMAEGVSAAQSLVTLDTARGYLDLARQKYGNEEGIRMAVDANSGMTWETFNQKYPNASEDDFRGMVRAGSLGRQNLNDALSIAEMMLSTGDPAMMQQAAGVISNTFAGVPGFEGIDFSKAIEDVGIEEFKNGMSNLVTYANTYGSFEEALPIMRRDGTLETLGMSEDEARKIFSASRTNALDEVWSTIESSKMFKDLYGNQPEIADAIKNFIFEGETGLNAFAVVETYEITDDKGNVVRTVNGENAAEYAVAGRSGWGYRSTGETKIVPKDVLTGVVAGLPEAPIEQVGARAQLNEGDFYVYGNKIYSKGAADDPGTDIEYVYNPENPWDKGSDFIIEQGKDFPQYDEVVKDRTQSIVNDTHKLDVGEITETDPVYQAVLKDPAMVNNLGTRELDTEPMASKEKYWFTGLKDLVAGTTVVLNKRIYKLDGTPQIIDRGGNNPTVYWLRDIETGARYFVAAYGRSKARPTIDRPAPESLYRQWENEETKVLDKYSSEF